jgi:hypothetical protein
MGFLLSIWAKKFSGSLAITCLKLSKKATVFEFAHKGEVDETRRVHVGEPRIYAGPERIDSSVPTPENWNYLF